MDAAVEAATSETLLDVNWDQNLRIADHVTNAGLPGAQAAMAALRKRLMSRNSKIVLLALTVRQPCGARPAPAGARLTCPTPPASFLLPRSSMMR